MKENPRRSTSEGFSYGFCSAARNDSVKQNKVCAIFLGFAIWNLGLLGETRPWANRLFDFVYNDAHLTLIEPCIGFNYVKIFGCDFLIFAVKNIKVKNMANKRIING